MHVMLLIKIRIIHIDHLEYKLQYIPKLLIRQVNVTEKQLESLQRRSGGSLFMNMTIWGCN